MGESPVRVEVLTQLQHHGIPPEQITYPRVALSAPWRLCVRHGPPQDPAGARVTLLDLREPHSPATHSWPLHQAQGALAHPSQPLLALRAGCVAQVFDVAQRCLRWQWTFAHPLEFWAWLEPETLALVTEEEVFHWALSREHAAGHAPLGNCQAPWEEGPKPRRQFWRHERLWHMEVVGYQRDASGLWLALSTLGLDQGQVVGLTQLHWRGGGGSPRSSRPRRWGCPGTASPGTPIPPPPCWPPSGTAQGATGSFTWWSWAPTSQATLPCSVPVPTWPSRVPSLGTSPAPCSSPRSWAWHWCSPSTPCSSWPTWRPPSPCTVSSWPGTLSLPQCPTPRAMASWGCAAAARCCLSRCAQTPSCSCCRTALPASISPSACCSW
ncbi:uncharacterized protein LOC119857905 isoform X2 [Dermochelys coriacea]|uniref:uncharacterized protein LOC119857905 isoform X2 n=1 Tax=Dermochelys coriacea TaxID=27794 RepID=UPI001CA9E1A1|nr:uncharacterized protein LOC119857905 isoform X2 [Dermochelys coriacea]